MLLQGIFPTQGLNPRLTSPALARRFFTTSATWVFLPKHANTKQPQIEGNAKKEKASPC